MSQSRKHNRVGDTHFRLRKRYKSHTSRRTLRLRFHRRLFIRLRSCQLYSWSHNLLKLCCP